jgi:hypothetical protein
MQNVDTKFIFYWCFNVDFAIFSIIERKLDREKNEVYTFPVWLKVRDSYYNGIQMFRESKEPRLTQDLGLNAHEVKKVNTLWILNLFVCE